MALKLVHSEKRAGEPSGRGSIARKAPMDEEPRGGWYARLRQDRLDSRLFAAVMAKDDKRALKWIIEGADVDAKDEHGQTPIMIAANHGSDQTVRLLISMGADVNAQDNLGGTALMSAVDQGHLSTARLLKDNGAKVNPRDSETSCTIRIAKSTGDWPMVRLLEGAQ